MPRPPLARIANQLRASCRAPTATSASLMPSMQSVKGESVDQSIARSAERRGAASIARASADAFRRQARDLGCGDAEELHLSLPCDAYQHMRGGCPVGCCICAVRCGEQVVVGRLSSSSAAWPGKVFGGGRVQWRLLGTAREQIAPKGASSASQAPRHTFLVRG